MDEYINDCLLKRRKKNFVFWEYIFKKVNGEIEVMAVEQSSNRKTCIVNYLMPYSEVINEYSFDIDSEVQDAIDGFCSNVRERGNEMIAMIKSCTDDIENYFEDEKEKK